MVKAVMRGYDESDMNGLFQSTRKKVRSTAIFIICLILDILILAALFIIPKYFDFEINSGITRPFKWIMAGILAFGIFQIAGDSKATLKSYPKSFKEGYVFAGFTNTEFYYAAVPKEALYNPKLVENFTRLFDRETQLHYYHEIKNIIEDRERFYLFPKNSGILPLIVRKNSISEGTVDELRGIFSFQMKDKFKVLNSKPPQEDVW